MSSQTGPGSLVDSRLLWNTISIYYSFPLFLPTCTLFLMAEVKLCHQEPEFCSFASFKGQCTSASAGAREEFPGAYWKCTFSWRDQGESGTAAWLGRRQQPVKKLPPLLPSSSPPSLYFSLSITFLFTASDMAKLCSSSFSQHFQRAQGNWSQWSQNGV